MVEIIDGEKYSWMKIIITKNWEYTHYRFVNLSYWSIEEDYKESARSFIENEFDDEYMGYRGYSWRWELIDKPPVEVIKKKIESIEYDIASLEKTKKTYEGYLESG